MKMQLTLMLLLMGVSLSILTGCKKHDRIDSTITETFTTKTVNEDGTATLTGPFTSTGGLTTSGTSVMDVTYIGDSSFCNDALTTSNGSFTMKLNCSRTSMTGHWKVVSGTGVYASLSGNGPLTMMFPPNVPAGVFVIETITGKFYR